MFPHSYHLQFRYHDHFRYAPLIIFLLSIPPLQLIQYLILETGANFRNSVCTYKFFILIQEIQLIVENSFLQENNGFYARFIWLPTSCKLISNKQKFQTNIYVLKNSVLHCVFLNFIALPFQIFFSVLYCVFFIFISLSFFFQSILHCVQPMQQAPRRYYSNYKLHNIQQSPFTFLSLQNRVDKLLTIKFLASIYYTKQKKEKNTDIK
eukprot:TRINITY_DN8168_c0_g1_i1.p1 TRINITY_DN8168_c0_g1~~TRINITY_DN8168_c0_g1_i1.p1  ORF type:complete len:208 (+),score=-17.76 TRINITY_DN8168_c0_g1_i1:181-804(+)